MTPGTSHTILTRRFLLKKKNQQKNRHIFTVPWLICRWLSTRPFMTKIQQKTNSDWMEEWNSYRSSPWFFPNSAERSSVVMETQWGIFKRLVKVSPWFSGLSAICKIGDITEDLVEDLVVFRNFCRISITPSIYAKNLIFLTGISRRDRQRKTRRNMVRNYCEKNAHFVLNFFYHWHRLIFVSVFFIGFEKFFGTVSGWYLRF